MLYAKHLFIILPFVEYFNTDKTKCVSITELGSKIKEKKVGYFNADKE